MRLLKCLWLLWLLDVASSMPVGRCRLQTSSSACWHQQHISCPVQVVVFSWSRCPFCVKAKSALKSMNAKFVAVELDQMPEGAAMRAELAKVCRVALAQLCPMLHAGPDVLRHAAAPIRASGTPSGASQ